jgi:hypothetical protein
MMSQAIAPLLTFCCGLRRAHQPFLNFVQTQILAFIFIFFFIFVFPFKVAESKSLPFHRNSNLMSNLTSLFHLVTYTVGILALFCTFIFTKTDAINYMRALFVNLAQVRVS